MQKRCNGEICVRFKALERRMSKLTSDIGSLKESLESPEDDLTGVKDTV